MRKAFLNTLIKLAEKDEHIYLVTADMGFNLVEPFAEKYHDRFINVGVAEQNMMGIATGLALSGKIVFAYSIANFPTLRCVEHIRNDICYHNLNVNIVSGNTGLSYGSQGNTHHATEDIAVMRALPNMTVIAPSDSVETELATQAIAKGIGACYLRLCKEESAVYKIAPQFQVGKAITIVGGNFDIMIISTGSMVHIALLVSKQLAQKNISVGVMSMHTVKPVDVEAILTSAKVAHIIITLEEHNIVGGLGSAVAEVLAEAGEHIYFKRLGIPDIFYTMAGTKDELLSRCHLAVDDICDIISGGKNEKIFV